MVVKVYKKATTGFRTKSKREKHNKIIDKTVAEIREGSIVETINLVFINSGIGM